MLWVSETTKTIPLDGSPTLAPAPSSDETEDISESKLLLLEWRWANLSCLFLERDVRARLRGLSLTNENVPPWVPNRIIIFRFASKLFLVTIERTCEMWFWYLGDRHETRVSYHRHPNHYRQAQVVRSRQRLSVYKLGTLGDFLSARGRYTLYGKLKIMFSLDSFFSHVVMWLLNLYLITDHEHRVKHVICLLLCNRLNK